MIYDNNNNNNILLYHTYNISLLTVISPHASVFRKVSLSIYTKLKG